jgi:hypothetical protein
MYFKDGTIGERRGPFAAAFQACQQLPQFGQVPNAGGMADLSLAQRTHAGVANAGESATYLGVF